MPKEIIDSRYFGQTSPNVSSDGIGDTETALESTYLHVGWTKDHDHVEVAVLNPTVVTDKAHDAAAGWFVQLDRHGINRAIRALRTARDQAFGRDE